jgi:hypothetical protein
MANQYTLKNGGYEPFIGNFGVVPQPPIPEPDAEDNGKVLGVSDGSYALVNGGGGGGSEPFIVNIADEGDYEALDATWAEISIAYNAGIPVYLRLYYADPEAPDDDYGEQLYTVIGVRKSVSPDDSQYAVLGSRDMTYISTTPDGTLTRTIN